LPLHDHNAYVVLYLRLEPINSLVLLDGAFRKRPVVLLKRCERLANDLFGEPTHLGNLAIEGGDVDLLSYGQRVIDLNSEIAHCTLDFGVAQQELNCSKISRLFIDQGSLGPAEGMRAIEARKERSRQCDARVRESYVANDPKRTCPLNWRPCGCCASSSRPCD